MTTTATNFSRKNIFEKLIHPNPDAAYSLAFFRIGFGILMCYSLIRFALKGWIYELYILPKVYFPFYGFEWIKPLPSTGMYIVFALLIVFTICICIGYYYRIAITAFFLLFTYVELIDKTNYLNHYYFISLVSFLMIFLPMNAAYSFDNKSSGFPEALEGSPRLNVLNWHLWILLLQIGSVYFFAGIAKIKYDWLFNAQPLTIWLHANNDLPIIGSLLDEKITAYTASWFGMIFDISLPFLLLWKPTRIWAYAAALFFHVCTGILFHIGMFPYIMMFCALIFYPSVMHRKWLGKFDFWSSKKIFVQDRLQPVPTSTRLGSWFLALGSYLLIPFLLFQLVMPFRYLLYPGDPFLGEEGFRFSWNVMLMEKNGLCEFYVVNPETKMRKTIYPHEWLTKQQERMMSTQPDMILQFAHMLVEDEKSNGNFQPEVYSSCYAAVNGKASRLLINPDTDLAKENENLFHKNWILNAE